MSFLTQHIFSEPDPSIGIDVDADAYAVQGCAEKVDAVPAAERFVRHAFLHQVDMRPGRSGWSGQADIFTAVAQSGEALIGDALVLCHAIGAGMAEAAMGHVPAMQQRAGGQGIVPGEGRQSAVGAVGVDQLKKLLSELLRFS